MPLNRDMEVALLGDCPLLAPAVRGAAHELVGAEEAVPRGPGVGFGLKLDSD